MNLFQDVTMLFFIYGINYLGIIVWYTHVNAEFVAVDIGADLQGLLNTLFAACADGLVILVNILVGSYVHLVHNPLHSCVVHHVFRSDISFTNASYLALPHNTEP